MNVKQFANSVICAAFQRFKWLRWVGAHFASWFFPSFLRIPLPNIIRFEPRPRKREFLWLYLIPFLVVFVVQGVLAFFEGRFWPDSDPLTKNFLEDAENLLDYILIVEAYVISGYLFLILSRDSENAIREKSHEIGVSIELKPEFKSGWLACVAVLVAGMLGISGYAKELSEYSFHYWFMESHSPVTFGFSGYYYLYINAFLLTFVCWVGFSHFGLFLSAGRIAKAIRNVDLSSLSTNQRDKIEDSNWIKRWLAPMSWQLVASKVFVLSIVLNLITWKTNEPKAGAMFDLGVIFVALMGMWIFAIPRYFIQYQFFYVWKKMGLDEYKDLRLPWIAGIGAVIDFALISLAVNVLITDRGSSVKLMEKWKDLFSIFG